jgi:SRSO17 transposase
MSMCSPSALETIFLILAPVFTSPSLANFAALSYGWVLAGARGTVSRAIRAAGELAPKHFSTYYRFFSRARWSGDALGLALLPLLLRFAPAGTVVMVVDDTLTRKSGRHIWGANLHHDPLQWICNAVSFGHNWVVLAVLIRVPLVERPVAVPLFLRLYRSKAKRQGKNAAGKSERKNVGAPSDKEYRARPELAIEMLAIARNALEAPRTIHVLGDSAYGGKSVSRNLPDGVHLTSRMCMIAALYEQPLARKDGQKGRSRAKGKRLSSPQEMAQSKSKWQQAHVKIYGKVVPVLYKQIRALWYNSAGSRMLNIVVVRDPKGRRKDDCFFSTDLSLTAVGILEMYALRWALEIAFRDIKQFLGLEGPQSRTQGAVSRTVPFICAVHAVAIAWFCEQGHRLYKKSSCGVGSWYTHKKTPSFQDMLRLLRLQVLRECFFATPAATRGQKNRIAPPTALLRLVA